MCSMYLCMNEIFREEEEKKRGGAEITCGYAYVREGERDFSQILLSDVCGVRSFT